jgi:hypothetical protein
VNGDDRIQARPRSAPNQQLLVVELLEVGRYWGPVGVNTAPLSAPGRAAPDPLEIVVSPETVVLGAVVDRVAPDLPAADVPVPVAEPVVAEPAEPVDAPVPVPEVPVTPVAGAVVGDVGAEPVGVATVVPGAEPVPAVVVVPGAPTGVLAGLVLPAGTSGA